MLFNASIVFGITLGLLGWQLLTGMSSVETAHGKVEWVRRIPNHWLYPYHCKIHFSFTAAEAGKTPQIYSKTTLINKETCERLVVKGLVSISFLPGQPNSYRLELIQYEFTIFCWILFFIGTSFLVIGLVYG